ncbi:RING/FYVE/PHD zinc finger superfamily protein [Forsythia ovata]|uniref:RING/FYVE/PHD zinc finger superfamily protein n=1 Tax=Forsythia ovata TaxID=205694 RepID=A0ABD1WY31_9LAMI
MATSEITQVDLECGGSGGGDGEEEEEGNVFFSDADEGSCYSQFYSTVDGDGSYDDYSIACGSESGEILKDEVLDSRRASLVADSDSDSSDCSVDIENGGFGETKVHLERVERDCRICHLSLVSSSPESGVAIELGCSCKDDLAAAHKHCAETWFKIKGNKTCEICNSIACNVVGPSSTDGAQQTNETNAVGTNTPSAPASLSTDSRSCLNGHRFLNFLLACMVFAFVISWLFHFNIPS